MSMDENTMEFLQDCLSLVGNLALVILIAYIVFWKGNSPLWFLTLLLFRFRFVPSKNL